jgi:hypothetical protein
VHRSFCYLALPPPLLVLPQHRDADAREESIDLAYLGVWTRIAGACIVFVFGNPSPGARDRAEFELYGRSDSDARARRVLWHGRLTCVGTKRAHRAETPDIVTYEGKVVNAATVVKLLHSDLAGEEAALGDQEVRLPPSLSLVLTLTLAGRPSLPRQPRRSKQSTRSTLSFQETVPCADECRILTVSNGRARPAACRCLP